MNFFEELKRLMNEFENTQVSNDTEVNEPSESISEEKISQPEEVASTSSYENDTKEQVNFDVSEDTQTEMVASADDLASQSIDIRLSEIYSTIEKHGIAIKLALDEIRNLKSYFEKIQATVDKSTVDDVLLDEMDDLINKI